MPEVPACTHGGGNIDDSCPPGFFGETLHSDPADLWLPLQQEPVINGEGSLLRQSIPAIPANRAASLEPMEALRIE